MNASPGRDNGSTTTLRTDAEAIWRAGVAAVDSRELVRTTVTAHGNGLRVAGEFFSLGPSSRIVVVGAGKAGAGMAAGVEDALRDTCWFSRLDGWLNVPADCVVPPPSTKWPSVALQLHRVYLHAARPAGLNEPTAEGVVGADRMLALVSDLGPRDLCLVLLSGGGSALLPAPPRSVPLADKQLVTRALMSAGASITELNCVRKQLSRIKGGRLALAASHTRMAALIISDVIGDPLDVIASGPTVADTSTAADAVEVLRRYGDSQAWPASVLRHLATLAAAPQAPPPSFSHVRNHVIGNNALALRAAAEAARARGYDVQSLGSKNAGEAADVGRELVRTCHETRARLEPGQRVCLLSGGEPVVHLAQTTAPRKGGRNQELALAALDACWETGLDDVVLLSGGTDGEDGPTDAAGAIADAEVLATARATAGAHPAQFLAINDSYTFFAKTGGLFKTGPTHTNVMDLRVALVQR